MNDTIRFWLLVVAFFVIGWLLAELEMSDADEAQAQVDHYCKMVSIHIQSRGEYGWPDFENKYDRECKE